MPENILVASRQEGGIADIGNILGEEYTIKTLGSAAEYAGDLADYELLLLDQNFTDYNGIDFLMSVLVNNQTPALVMTSPEDPESAAEAMNVGAFNFIVKSDGYEQLLPFAVSDSIKRFNELRSMQATISTLKENVTTLEKKISERPVVAPATAASAPTAPPLVEKVERNLLQDVILTLKSGEVNLPVYPEISARFKELVNRAANVKEISDLLQKDPAISSKMISVSNSAYYRGMVQIKTLEQALSRVGISEARNYVALISNRALYTMEKEKFSEYLASEWRHALCCAYVSQELSRALLIKNPAELFAMGLFHGIGKILLVQILAKLENGSNYDDIPNEEWKALVDQHHCQFGASLLKKWKLASEYWQVAKWHEDPSAAGEELSDEIKMVHLANIVAKDMGYRDPDHKDFVDYSSCPPALELSVSEEKMQDIKVSVHEMMEAGLVV